MSNTTILDQIRNLIYITTLDIPREKKNSLKNLYRYKYLADKERHFLDQLTKVNREMTNLTKAMLDAKCEPIDETMKSIYKADYAKRGIELRWTKDEFVEIIRSNEFRIAYQRVQTVTSCGWLAILFTFSGGSYGNKGGIQRSNEISIHSHRETVYSTSQNDQFVPRYGIFLNVYLKSPNIVENANIINTKNTLYFREAENIEDNYEDNFN